MSAMKKWGLAILAIALLGFSTLSFASFPKQRPAAGVSVFIFDPRMPGWAVYGADGQLLKTGKASGGRSYCKDTGHKCHTVVGTFKIYSMGGAACKSKKFPIGKGGAPMPYCYYFHKGFAIHGSYEVRNYNASHGCIRLYPADAKWLRSVLHPGSIVIVKPY